jgi:hypothetical protein
MPVCLQKVADAFHPQSRALVHGGGPSGENEPRQERARMVPGLIPRARLFHESGVAQVFLHAFRVLDKNVVHPVKQARAGPLDKLLFKTSENGIFPFAVVKEVETELFRFSVLLPVETFFFHNHSPSVIKSFLP